MKHTYKLGMSLLGLLAALVLASCGSILHNGTEMDISSVTLGSLPPDVYPVGQTLIFDFCYSVSSDTWVHNGMPAELTNPSSIYASTVQADGSITWNFSTPLIVKDSVLKFLIVDNKNPPSWNTMKIDKKVSGKSGGDVIFDNAWCGVADPVTVTGVVSGDDVNWTLQDLNNTVSESAQ